MVTVRYTAIKMTGMTPLHIGTGRENYDFSESILHSDTISSALAALRAQNGKAEDIESFMKSFCISSAFPYFKERFFLPRLAGRINVRIQRMSENEYRKKLKNVKYLEFPVWSSLLDGRQIEITEGQLQKDFLVTGNEDIKTVIRSETRQRVSVPRSDNTDASPFFFDWKFFDKDAGLYCLTDASGDSLDEIVSLFRQLGENGIGTDKNVGGGKFSVSVSSLEIQVPDTANAQALLSMYIPEKEEMKNLDLEHSRYGIVSRGGYIAGSCDPKFWHLRKKSVFMFREGSVICSREKLSGKIVDIRPEWNDGTLHKVFRSGKALAIPINTEII